MKQGGSAVNQGSHINMLRSAVKNQVSGTCAIAIAADSNPYGLHRESLLANLSAGHFPLDD